MTATDPITAAREALEECVEWIENCDNATGEPMLRDKSDVVADARAALSALPAAAGAGEGEYEFFRDPAYYDMWAVRAKGSASFNDTIHVATEQEAARLASLLSRRPVPPSEGGELATKLRELDAKATPGPWKVFKTVIGGVDYGKAWVEPEDVEEGVLCSGSGGARSWTRYILDAQGHDDNDPNADLIVFLRNNVETILASLSSADECAKLRGERDATAHERDELTIAHRHAVFHYEEQKARADTAETSPTALRGEVERLTYERAELETAHRHAVFHYNEQKARAEAAEARAASARDEGLERAAKVADAKAAAVKISCECEGYGCTCGNYDDAGRAGADAAERDTLFSLATAIRSLKGGAS